MFLPQYRKSTLTTPDGAVIEYMELGTGTPVLLIPGAGDAARTAGQAALSLAHMFKPYAPRHRLVYMSRREPIPQGWTPRELARDYIWAMEQLGTGPWHVECNSGGGPIGQWVAAERPDLVRSLVLGQTFAHVDAQLRAILERWLNFARTRRWYEFFTDSVVYSASKPYLRKMRWLFPLYHLIPAPKSPQRVERVFEGLLDVDNRALLPKITCPALIIAGDADKVSHPALQDTMERLLPNVRRVVLPGQGHMAVSEVTAEHFRHVLSFFADVDNGRKV